MQINTVYLKGQEEACGYNNPNKIIIHHPEWQGDIYGLNDLMRNMGFYMVGYNYYVRKDGSVWKGRPDNATSANCFGQNNQSLGVCFEGNFEVDTMGTVQFNAGVELIKSLKNKYGINEVGGHKKYFNTACPGKNFPLDEMLNAINSNVQNVQVVANKTNTESSQGFSYTNNAKMGNDWFRLRDSNGNILSGGHMVTAGDDLTILDVSYSKQLVLLEYPTSHGVIKGYIMNNDKIIYKYQDRWHNGSTPEVCMDESGNVIGSISAYESATPIYRKNGMLHVVYSTGKGRNTKSGFVRYNGGFTDF